MNILFNILVPIICLLFGYLLGSFPTAIFIGKVFFHQDPREHGSKNAGGTNAGRLWGKKVGFTVIVIDMLKTIAPLWIGWAILTFVPMYEGMPLCAPATEINNLGMNFAYTIAWPCYYLIPIGCLLGHCWPCFAQFKGGKGVSCYMGIAIVSSWLIGIVPGLTYFITLKKTKMVSVASTVTPGLIAIVSWIYTILMILGVIPESFIYWMPMMGATMVPGLFFSIMLTVMAVVIIVRHRGNFKRIKEGTERKISWMK